MDTQLSLTILSPEKELFSGEVLSVTLPGEKGRFTVLPLHAPIISSLVQGALIYQPVTADTQPVSLQITGGFVEVKENRVTVCVEI